MSSPASPFSSAGSRGPEPIAQGILAMPVSLGFTRASVLCLLLVAAGTSVCADDWPQWRGPNRDGVWRETGVVDRLPGPDMPIKWRVPIGSGYTGPTVCGGRVYVCDRVTAPREEERLHCFDARTGKQVWTHAHECAYKGFTYTAGPRGAVTVRDGRAYSLGAMGHLLCLASDTGAVLWQKDLNREYGIRMPQWGVSAAPLVEGALVVVQIGGRDDACVVAFDRRTGAERWRALPDRASYSSPVIVRQAGKRVLVCWTGDRVVGLDPLSGAVHWQHPFPSPKMVIGIADPVSDGARLFISDFFEGSLMLALGRDGLTVQELWRRKGENERNTDSLHCLIGTPILDGDHVYGIDSYGELRCLDARTGDRVWESLEAGPKVRWGTVHFVRNADKVWMLNERGELIISRLTPSGFEQISRARLLKPTRAQHGRGVCWSHPAFADRHVFARNDEELVCADLTAK